MESEDMMTGGLADTLLMFRRNCCLHFHDRRNFYSEDGGSRVLRNTGTPLWEAILNVSTWRWRQLVIAQGTTIFIASILRISNLLSWERWHAEGMSGYCSLWAMRLEVDLHMPKVLSLLAIEVSICEQKNLHRWLGIKLTTPWMTA
jgi:hypothetical protein